MAAHASKAWGLRTGRGSTASHLVQMNVPSQCRKRRVCFPTIFYLDRLGSHRQPRAPSAPAISRTVGVMRRRTIVSLISSSRIVRQVAGPRPEHGRLWS